MRSGDWFFSDEILIGAGLFFTMASPERRRFPGEVDAAHPEPFTVAPPDVEEKKEGQLPREEIQKFFDEGYIVVRDYFSREQLDPCTEDISLMVDQLANKLYTAGKISDLYSDYGLFERLTKLEDEYPGSNVLLFKFQKMPKVTLPTPSLTTIVPCPGQSFQRLWTNDRLLNLMEQILGPDVAGHPVWNLRTKTPRSEAVNIPWHQDSAYMSNESYDHMIASAWIPFLDATPENGTLQLAKKGHRSGKVAVHECCAGPTWYIMLQEEKMRDTLGVDLAKDIVTEPVPCGSFILFNNLIPHRSLPNVSNQVRWSVDLRWQSPHHNYGFYDIQDGVIFRSRDQPNLVPDWEKFFSVDRKEVWRKQYAKAVSEGPDEGQFDTRITGPWIGKWETVHHNSHTDLFQQITA
ncbi:hypothetical protein EGW08_004794 [Elysia chlorotica]|uniref:Fe2OG dioxygenase domain-containing protein n=1 Tax=Elysia chlorotica TaxID=188477 RepID=A0A3S0ZW16_ELYCH|nr:hypothetical protein EGW08_004794 [Elysia chlorotica]